MLMALVIFDWISFSLIIIKFVPLNIVECNHNFDIPFRVKIKMVSFFLNWSLTDFFSNPATHRSYATLKFVADAQVFPKGSFIIPRRRRGSSACPARRRRDAPAIDVGSRSACVHRCVHRTSRTRGFGTDGGFPGELRWHRPKGACAPVAVNCERTITHPSRVTVERCAVWSRAVGYCTGWLFWKLPFLCFFLFSRMLL